MRPIPRMPLLPKPNDPKRVTLTEDERRTAWLAFWRAIDDIEKSIAYYQDRTLAQSDRDSAWVQHLIAEQAAMAALANKLTGRLEDLRPNLWHLDTHTDGTLTLRRTFTADELKRLEDRQRRRADEQNAHQT